MNCKFEGNCKNEIDMGKEGCYFAGKAERWLGNCLYLKTFDQVKAEAQAKKVAEERAIKAKEDADAKRIAFPVKLEEPKPAPVEEKVKLPSKKVKAGPEAKKTASKKTKKSDGLREI